MQPQGLTGMGGMSSASVKRKSGLTFDYILSRLQVGLQKSCETGDDLTGANDIYDTLGESLVSFVFVLLRKYANDTLSQPPNLHLPQTKISRKHPNNPLLPCIGIATHPSPK